MSKTKITSFEYYDGEDADILGHHFATGLVLHLEDGRTMVALSSSDPIVPFTELKDE
jgi:hypothetical protein